MVALRFTIPQKAAEDKAREPFYQAKLAHYQLLLSQQSPGRRGSATRRARPGRRWDKAADLLATQAPGRGVSRRPRLHLQPLHRRPGVEREPSTRPRDAQPRPPPGGERIADGAAGLDQGLDRQGDGLEGEDQGQEAATRPAGGPHSHRPARGLLPDFRGDDGGGGRGRLRGDAGPPVRRAAGGRRGDQGEVPEAALPLALRHRPAARAAGHPQRGLHRLRPVPAHRLGRGAALGAEGRRQPRQTEKPAVGPGVAQPPAQPRGKGGRGEGRRRGILRRRSPDRGVCVYVAQVGPAVVVTNSLKQLERLVDTQAGKRPRWRRRRSTPSSATATPGGRREGRGVRPGGPDRRDDPAVVRPALADRRLPADARRGRAGRTASRPDGRFRRRDAAPAVLHTDRPLPMPARSASRRPASPPAPTARWSS